MALCACEGGTISVTDTATIVKETGTADSGETGLDSGDTGDSADTGNTQDTDTTVLDPRCLDFETGLLVDLGYVGDKAVLWDGAILAIAGEGEDFSALTAEEGIDMPGDYSLLMRSSDEGEVDSISIATTPDFWVVDPHLTWMQLSEVDERGLVLAVDVLTPESTVLASAMVPLAGAHQPGLLEETNPLEELPEVVVGPGVPGTFEGQAIDLSPWLDQEVKVRFYQHTLVEGSGFFTLMDDLCPGTASAEHALVELGEPSDRW